MLRALAVSIFAVAAAASALAGTGVSVPPHRMPIGTPAQHTMPLGSYRFALLVEPAVAAAPLSAKMAALHKLLASAGIPIPDDMHAHAAEGPFFQSAPLAIVSDLALVLALLAVFVPRLGRPSRRPLGTLAVRLLLPGQLVPAPILGPPRV